MFDLFFSVKWFFLVLSIVVLNYPIVQVCYVFGIYMFKYFILLSPNGEHVDTLYSECSYMWPECGERVLFAWRRAGTATGRKGSMWAAVPAVPADAADADDEDGVPLGPGQLPPRNGHLPPLHAEINISIIMIKGQLELEVSHARRVYGINGEVPDSYVKCYLREGEKWLHKRKTRVVRRTTEPHFKQTLKYQASEALGRTLLVMLWQRCGGFEHNLALGGAEIALDQLTLPQRTYGWYPLFPAHLLAAAGDASPD